MKIKAPFFRINLFLALFLAVGIALPLEACSSLFTRDIGVASKDLTENIHILYYPNNGLDLTRVDIEVEGIIWNASGGYGKTGDYQARLRAAKRFDHLNMLNYQISITESELKNIKEYLSVREGRRELQSCVSGLCKLLRNNTGINIPFPFTQVPSLSALYLRVYNKLSKRRVKAVEYFGNNQVKTFIRSKSIPLEVITIATLYKLVEFLGLLF